jgi:Tol biopolymer transport system component
MTLAAGTRLGTFEILDIVGAGGMGEVYRARDTRLERTVAIKVLPVHWADDREMKQRFEREAQAIASLSHPNICTLHDIGHHSPSAGAPAIDFLVMEYLDGETLAQRLERGAVELDEAVRIGIAIADALDKAHRRGVTHRDLKPGNVFLVRGRGSSDPPIVKLLDFGLAKIRGGTTAPGSGSPAPVIVSALPTNPQLTAHGMILGTLQYMAPEQLEGLEADARTDIFAFGVVMHEMISGKKTFEGKSRVLLMSAIVTAEPPPLSAVQPASSPALDQIVKTCLMKDPADRWQTSRDLLAELQWIAAGGADAIAVKTSSTRQRFWTKASLPLTGAAVVLVLAGAFLLANGLRRPVADEELRVRIPIQLSAESLQQVAPAAFDGSNFAIAPDGRTLAFVARGGAADPLTIYVRPLASVTPQKLPGTEDASQLFWSADSRSIAFVSGGKLKKVEATGGPPQDICSVADFWGGDWNSSGVIAFGSSKGLFRVSAQGGTPEALTTPQAPESGHYWPRFLPDGRRFLYLAWSGQPTGRAIFAGSLDSKERTKVIASESKAAYAEPGYVLFRRESAVYAQRFDVKTLRVSGEPIRVADGVTSAGSVGQGNFSVSSAGPLVYYFGAAGPGAGPQTDSADWQMAWVDRVGGQVGVVGPPGPYRGVELSPDGTRIATHKHESAGGDIFVIEPRGAMTRLTFDASRHNSMPLWSPDGTRIVYSSLQKGKWGLYRTLSNGSGTEELLFESDLPKAPMSWSPDGKLIVFWVQDPKNGGDLWVLPLEGDKKPEPFLATPYNESHAQISPDGKWIAYASNSTGGRTEVYVRPFPSGSGVYQISTNGGDWPRWNRDGKELLFHALGTGAFVAAILTAPINGSGAAFEATDPKEVVRTAALNLPHSGGDYHTYGLHPDGKRMLVFQFVGLVGNATVVSLGADPSFGLIAALNWSAGLKK